MQPIIVSNIEATPALSGATIRALMRQHKVAMRPLAAANGLTLKRIREVRANGTPPGFIAGEWVKMLTGRWPDHPIAA